MKKNLFLTIFSVLFVSSFLLAISLLPVYSQGILPQASGDAASGCEAPSGYEGGNASYCGDYEINDFVFLAINVAKWILGIVGSLSLIMFIYGGLMFMISGGSSDKVSKAKQIVVASVVGLLIVFSSWMIVRFATESIGVSQSYQFDGTVK